MNQGAHEPQVTQVVAERIDTHLHLWQNLELYPWLNASLTALYREFSAAEGLAASSAFGCAQALLVQAADNLADTEFLLQQVAAEPQLLGAVCWVPLTDVAWLQRELPRLLQRGLRGVRELIHDQPDTQLLDRADYRAGLHVLAQHQVPFEVPDAYPAQLPAAIRLAREMPELMVVLDHMGKPPAEFGKDFLIWEKLVREFAALPNTVAKLSGLHHGGVCLEPEMFARVWEIALDAFGADRLLLGSDFPMPLLADGVDIVAELTEQELLKLDSVARTKICFGSAQRVYGLQHRR